MTQAHPLTQGQALQQTRPKTYIYTIFDRRTCNRCMDDLIGGGHHALGGDRDGLPTDELVNSGIAQFEWPFQLESGENLALVHSPNLAPVHSPAQARKRPPSGRRWCQ